MPDERRRRRTLAATAAILAAVACAGSGGAPRRADTSVVELGAGLAPGATLRYVRDGTPQPAWTVDSVARGITHAGRSGCARIVRRMAPTAAAEVLLLCAAGDTLLAWNARGGGWAAARPLGALTLVLPRPGGSVQFEGSAPETDQVGGRGYRVVPTVVTTLDSTGRAVRRLRERYAPALATATSGVFEGRDSTGQWTRVAGFELVAVEDRP